MNCRFCGRPLHNVFIDLCAAPPSNSFLEKSQLNEPETYFPLKVFVCGGCFLVQVDECKKSAEIFSSGYVYFSSISRSWLEHARRYTEMIVPRLGLGSTSKVIEIASNDGYLLQYFAQKGICSLGIEPAGSVAKAAREKGLRVIEEFFGARMAAQLAGQGERADLVIGNNVLAHVPDINDFVEGLGIVLERGGTITMEFPHLMRLVENNQFDTIYHEHFSYLSLGAVCRIFEAHGLEIYDVEELDTHGGSLRIYAHHRGDPRQPVRRSVRDLLSIETEAGMESLDFYGGFQERAKKVKIDFLQFLIDARRRGKTLAAYGAAAKGNTLLNFCGIKPDLIEFVVDAAPSKQGKFLPGSRIPVVEEGMLRRRKPDYLIILPWNIKEEIMGQLCYIREWEGKFVTAIPEIRVV